MNSLKSEKKPTVEQLAKRLDKLEKRMTFVIIPAIITLLDETVFINRRGMGGHPLISWIIRKLKEENLPQEARDYLTDLLEKVDFSTLKKRIQENIQ